MRQHYTFRESSSAGGINQECKIFIGIQTCSSHAWSSFDLIEMFELPARVSIITQQHDAIQRDVNLLGCSRDDRQKRTECCNCLGTVVFQLERKLINRIGRV